MGKAQSYTVMMPCVLGPEGASIVLHEEETGKVEMLIISVLFRGKPIY